MKQIMEIKKEYEYELEIQDFLNQSSFMDAKVIILHFSICCITLKGDPIPGEIAACAFNIREGILGNYSSLIDPGRCIIF